MQNNSNLLCSASRPFMIWLMLAFASTFLLYSWHFCCAAPPYVSPHFAVLQLIAFVYTTPAFTPPAMLLHVEILFTPQDHTQMLPSLGNLSWFLSQDLCMSLIIYTSISAHGNLSSQEVIFTSLLLLPSPERTTVDHGPSRLSSKRVKCECAGSFH